jgi:hypothetical protein
MDTGNSKQSRGLVLGQELLFYFSPPEIVFNPGWVAFGLVYWSTCRSSWRVARVESLRARKKREEEAAG